MHSYRFCTIDLYAYFVPKQLIQRNDQCNDNKFMCATYNSYGEQKRFVFKIEWRVCQENKNRQLIYGVLLSQMK